MKESGVFENLIQPAYSLTMHFSRRTFSPLGVVGIYTRVSLTLTKSQTELSSELGLSHKHITTKLRRYVILLHKCDNPLTPTSQKEKQRTLCEKQSLDLGYKEVTATIDSVSLIPGCGLKSACG